MNSLSWKCLAVMALGFVMAGCGPSGPRLYKAGGTVTYKDKPVEMARVAFLYDDGNFASAITDANGKFQLAYMSRPGGGAALGKCSVSVVKEKNVVNFVAPTSKDPADMMKAMQAFDKAKKKQMEEEKAGGSQSALPTKYADAKASGLKFEITTDEAKNDFPIVLTD